MPDEFTFFGETQKKGLSVLEKFLTPYPVRRARKCLEALDSKGIKGGSVGHAWAQSTENAGLADAR